jgi:Na+/H+ antiporter NhaD/arsenite permease-like protein
MVLDLGATDLRFKFVWWLIVASCCGGSATFVWSMSTLLVKGLSKKTGIEEAGYNVVEFFRLFYVRLV